MNEKATDFVLYKGYKVYRDGTIISKNGRIISAYNLTHEGSHVKLKINGKTMVKNKAVLVYSCFGEEVDIYRYFIQFKNGDVTDASFDNLYLLDKKEYFSQMNFRGESRFTDNEKKKILREYKKRVQAEQNVSIRSFAIRYNCSYITMKKVLNSVL